MSYTPNTWASGDVVTAQKMNHIETGIASVGSGAIFHDAIWFRDQSNITEIEDREFIMSELYGGAEVYIIAHEDSYEGAIYDRFYIVGWTQETEGDLNLTFIAVNGSGTEYWIPETYSPPDGE